MPITVPEKVQVIRIPNLPVGKWVNEDGTPSDDFLTFMQALIVQLNRNMGNEGLVAPSQPEANIDIIEANATQQYVGGPVSRTCQFGTFIYQTDSLDPLTSVKVAVEDPIGSGIPVFKTVTLT